MVRFTMAAAVAIALAAGSLGASTAVAGDACCCPPPPHEVTLCVQDPCCGCPHQVCVCVPGCCTEAPTVCWRDGIFGRRVAEYTWPCCGYSVKVVITKHDEVIIRG